MRIATLLWDNRETVCLRTEYGYLPLEALDLKLGTRWSTELKGLLCSGDFYRLWSWYRGSGRKALAAGGLGEIPFAAAPYAPLYRHPGKIWGIGLNYAAHAADLSEKAPSGIPASFMYESS